MKVNPDYLLKKAFELDFLSVDEGLYLYRNAPLPELIFIANEIRKKLHPDNKVTWIIDRNVNITNVCISGCKFCNFYRPLNHGEAYITSVEQYSVKIDEMIKLGGKQLLLQGGLHPKLGLKFYCGLFKELKRLYPGVRLHALSPPEIVHICRHDNVSYEYALKKLISSGLDSLPGGGAEILADRVRKINSKVKCSAAEWLDVMRTAHKLGITTSATMMFGHLETLKERMTHLHLIRSVQAEKPEKSKGFVSFTPWPFQNKNTVLEKKFGIKEKVSGNEYIRMVAVSRMMLPNISNIQASWLTVGKEVAQVCLNAGANDMGSVMIEENVVSSAGAGHRMNAEQIQKAITGAGFKPQLRDQDYNYVKKPAAH